MTAYLPLAAAAVVLLAGLRAFRNYLFPSPLDNIPGPPSASFLTGNLSQFFATRTAGKFRARLTETYGAVSLIKGFLGKRWLVIHDVKALQAIGVKDQDSYRKALAPSNDLVILLGPSLLTTGGPQHKKQRKMMIPVFSNNHLRDMSHIFYNVSRKMRSAVASRVPTNGSPKILDMNSWMARTTLEILGQAGLGYSFDNFLEDSTDPYGESLKMFFPVYGPFQFFWFAFEPLTYVFSDAFIKGLLRLVPLRSLRRLLRISDTMHEHSSRIVEERKAALSKGDEAALHEVGEGKDIMSVCLKANMAAAAKDRLSDDELLAHMSTFILAGMDTTSNALSRILNLLAKNPSVQERLRAEIVEAQGGPGSDADIPYDDLIKLPYLDAVCRETLRLYAPVSYAPRVAAKDTVIPLATPVRGRDRTIMNELVVSKGTSMILHYQAANDAPELWGDDAHEWKPERWLSRLPKAVEDAHIPGVYSNLMTFAAGSRACIGFMFSQVETSRPGHSFAGVRIRVDGPRDYVELLRRQLPHDGRREPEAGDVVEGEGAVERHSGYF
ncbi:cytochrome P450 [Ganoderma sinense ZZ0214-1]|uniref:Cytochrome P450 n=1 Tax=Ganoderma sinense ZZ0214-1 TaxID=1077348 RepID=A0A2G8SL89_9APHY|nr:cytochrome P450 [Ganoderma sinense ZZ0214-1]